MNLFTLFNGACSNQIAFCWRTRMAWNALAIGRVRWKLWRMMQNWSLLALRSFSTLKSWSRTNLACKAATMPRDASYLVGIEVSAQPVDATQALNLSAGVSNVKVLSGRSLS